MDGVESNNDEINSDANCSCEENAMENEDTKFPDYSYRKRVNYLYSEISSDRCKKFQCLLCNFETDHLVSIRYHFMRHSNVRSHSCQNCEYQARDKSALKNICCTVVENLNSQLEVKIIVIYVTTLALTKTIYKVTSVVTLAKDHSHVTNANIDVLEKML